MVTLVCACTSGGSVRYCAIAPSIWPFALSASMAEFVSNRTPRSVTSLKHPISSTATPTCVFGQRSLLSVTPSLSPSPGGGGGGGGGGSGGGGGGGGVAATGAASEWPKFRL